jgi:hypothetical protein
MDQLEATARLLRARKRDRPFCALLWGDFNSRLVAFEELQNHVKRRDSDDDCWELLDSGVDLLVQMIDDPDRRRELLLKDSLLYEGKDLCLQDARPSQSCELLKKLFTLHVDAAKDQSFSVPLPTFKVTPLDVAVSTLVNCSVSSVEVVCLNPSHGSKTAMPATPRSLGDSTAESYFGWYGAKKGHTSQRDIKEDGAGEGKPGHQYLQLGWLDGVGVYKDSTAKARLTAWESDDRVQAFDHLPVRAVVEIDMDDGQPLKVWLGTLKLERRHPTPEALEALLYESEAASAKGADVVALSFTDLEVTQENAVELRNLLSKALKDDAADYVFNEEDVGLVLKHIPAQLVAVTNEGQRYMTLSVALHRRNVHDLDNDGDKDNFDCFPVPVYLTCKSPRKNEVTACGKALIGQDVVIGRNGKRIDLVLSPL